MAIGRRRKPFHLKLKKTTVYTFSSVAFFVIGGIIALSFSRQGLFLSKLHQLLVYYLGWGVIFLPFLLIVAGLMLSRLQWRISRPNVFAGSLLLLVSLTGLTQAGLVGFEIWQSLAILISNLGAFLVLAGFIFIGFVVTFNTSLEEIFLFLVKLTGFFKKLPSRTKFPTKPATDRADSRQTALPVKELAKSQSELGVELVSNSPTNGQVWEYPPLSLLVESISGKADRGDIKKNAETIEKTLESFGVAARVAEVNFGPAVTQYALEITLGTKLSKITALSNDLALALAAPGGQIRIEAPIPGRSLVGAEVPNHTPEFVTLRQMLVSEKMKKAKSKLTVALGLDVSGEPIVADIARMPHVLIAGSTGSGKSVCINSFICSILYRASPAEVKFILVDPKRVELTQYNGIPHLLSPVIIEPDKVLSALRWAVSEMDRRYKLFAEMGVRNIEGYAELSGLSSLPYIVIFIDELADIIFYSPAEVEDVICRIAQMARATGIHLVVSTQRPSVDVITGLIKANIPCRIAFNVSSQVDSRVILDSPGAEKLLGRGDMLFIPPDQAKPTRIQGTFVSDQEIQRVINHLRKNGVAPQYTEEVTNTTAPTSTGVAGEVGEKDELLEDAIRVIRQYDRASASLLQRRLKVGYARAARILDQMEQAGIVGPADGAKAREVNTATIDDYLAKQA
ncbi:DNA translocase FtsK [Candidatus Shapirobacteria bacterium CG09_land_8_20_14_0_10_47_13]|uniref:DNA translocase FtsK n=1 Tax=Candidatus Shapirobacteria bacterium CG09_land_8_20_14_0_10_47_13 TaxID=1974481 RepID=A0A2H0WNA0_9BACT|nr:MAG: DNA translocase FtsK [Candidatus Shapirobacteria bacterium CG09_land_8_20_14_0_10_47_13]